MSEPITYEEYLERYGSLTYTNVGTSMLPLLRQGRDLFVLKPKEGRCQKGDVVLFRRAPDRWILHRVVAVRDDAYLILGDNCLVREYVAEDDVVAVMTEFVRDGHRHSVDEPTYRAYTWLVLVTERPRTFLKRTLLKTRRLLRASGKG